ncbi:MAG: sugar phosphate isomerase/epimerase [Candidatus Brocadiia bacterium]|nr:MAG: sugar phosphate isomerase/epimerase [Candidatus Brocadiia bacterium]
MQKLNMSRRKMMLNSARAVAGLSLAGIMSSCRSGSGDLAGDKMLKKGFRIGACDWSLGKSSDAGSFEVARRLELDGVQVNAGMVGEELHLSSPEVQKTFLKAAEDNGMEIASLCLLQLNGIPYKSNPLAERWVVDSIEICREMKVKVVMIPCFGKGDILDDEKGVDVVVERLKQAAPKAEKAGVVIGLESLLSAEQHMDIIDRVGSGAVKVYYDLGNAHKKGYDIYKEIRFLGSRNICEFHAKDYNNLFGQGKIDFPRVRLAMDDIGYHGLIQIEGATPLGLEASYRHDGQYLKSIFPREV